jgi:hypothetical protein
VAVCERGGAFAACALHAAVGPAVDQGADESFRRPVGAADTDACGGGGRRAGDTQGRGQPPGKQDPLSVSTLDPDAVPAKDRDRGAGSPAVGPFSSSRTSTRASEPQLAQRHDQFLPLRRRSPRHRTRGQGTILQPRRALAAKAIDPLPRRAFAHPRSLGRRHERPPLHQHPIRKQPPRARTRPGVAVQCHRPTSLESLTAFDTHSLQGRSDEQRFWDLHLEKRTCRRAYCSRLATRQSRTDAAG